MAKPRQNKGDGPLNPELVKGVRALSRSAVYRKKQLWRLKLGPVAGQVKKVIKPAVATAAAPAKEPRFYPGDRVIKKISSRRSKQNPTKLRQSITPGTVLIVLAGRFKGKRVVFVKQLPSGLLLITGPFYINGVPLRRVSQAYVLATSTKIDIASVDAANIDDAFFAKSEASQPKKESDEFFSTEEPVKKVSPERKAAQGKIDQAISAAIGKNKMMRSYLNARFTLTKGQFPHLMKF